MGLGRIFEGNNVVVGAGTRSEGHFHIGQGGQDACGCDTQIEGHGST